MAKDDYKSVRADIRKKTEFWRLVNSYRYWNETQQYFVWEAVRGDYGVLSEDLHQEFLKFWETGQFYKMSVEEIEQKFHAYMGQVLRLAG